MLFFLIALMGKWSSKNISGQHRVILSFYSLMGILDGLSLWAYLILVLLQGEYWHAAVPGVALLANYFLNFKYIRLWNVIDPPKPEDGDDLTVAEIKLANNCDLFFDRWNEKYYNVASVIKKCVALLSHKLFHLPYTHFFGYLHFTVRIQDNY